MPLNFALGFRACCVALAISLATAIAAESRQHPLIGLTREQLLQRLGEPKSNIVAGNREVLLFSRERVVLRGNVVAEVDLLPTESVRRPAETPPPSANSPADPAGLAPAAADGTTPPGETAPKSTARKNTPLPPPPAPEFPPGEAPLEIRAVRKAGVGAGPAVKSEPAPVAAAPVTPTPVPASVPAVTPSVNASPAASATIATAPAGGSAAAAKSPAAENLPPADAPVAATAAVTDPDADAAKAANADEVPLEKKKKPAVAKKAPRRPIVEGEIVEESYFPTQTYVIGFLTIIGGAGYLIWRSRQRQLELAATTVSHTPFTPPASMNVGARFAPELLAKLEWKRFEELVAAYYSKTGVVAVRTKSGPASSVHIKISWKGEPRPFAFVQCIARPIGLVDAKPIQELAATLAAEDIRRGYVVTTGKFNVSARDFAEEKHITLLPGDIFLEKLNALPDTVRNELVQETTTGDYKTPSCPKCEAKMVPDDAGGWRCAAHPDATLPGNA